MIRVALRLDDPSETSNRQVEAGILDALQEAGIPATFGVIPFRMVNGARVALSPERAAPLIEAQRSRTMEVALHGYLHVSCSTDGRKSEFRDVPLPEQLERITEGRDHLEQIFGQRPTGFIPPWNSYDRQTLTALEQAGFSYVSANWDLSEDYRGPLDIIPLTCQLTDLKSAVQEARRYCSARPLIVAIMHHYDFAESGDGSARLDLAGFRSLVHWLAEQPDLAAVRLGDANAKVGLRHALAQQRLRKMPLISRFVPTRSILCNPLRNVLLSRIGWRNSTGTRQ
jgi:peptidoglycan/xylan/chitin deacetylase (PgdA/CDA1 family)